MEPATKLISLIEGPEVSTASMPLPFRSLLLLATLAMFMTGATYWCFQDYRRFKELGPGGPAYNVWGWMEVTFVVRPFTLSSEGTLWTGDYPSNGAHNDILSLPQRNGERPLIAGIAPQRQFSQCPGPCMSKDVHALFADIAYANPSCLQTRLSTFEKHNAALYVHPSLLASPSTSVPKSALATGELGHLHRDTSLHLYFSPADARLVIEKGWAQRHRMARPQPWWFTKLHRFWVIGPTFLLVYAPRDSEELAVLKTLIKASARFMTGGAVVAVP